MTDQAPAYAQALDQLRAERDAAVARADAAERQWAAIAGTPDGSWHVAYERAAAQLAEVTAERDELRAQLTIAEANSATSRAALEEGLVYQKQLQSERNAAIARADRAESCIRHADEQNRAVTSEMLAAVKHSDELRAQLEEWQSTARFAHEDHPAVALIRKEREALRAQLEAAEKERGTADTTTAQWFDKVQELQAQLTIANEATAMASAFHEQQKATIEALQAQLAVVTAERDHMRSIVPEIEAQLQHWKGRFVEPRTPTDLEMQTGPVAFERNQLRDELARLRAKHEQAVTELNAGYDTLYDELTRTKADRDKHEHRATMHERDADESSRAVTVLSTIIRASVEAIARGVK